MDNKRKGRQESGVETTPETGLGDLQALVTPKNQQKDKKRKKQKKQKQKKLLDELSNRLDEVTEIVKKLQKNSDLLEVSLKEKETPQKNVVERKCCFEDKDAFIQHEKSIFVFGFDCSFPRDDIKSALIKHFSSCGEILAVNIPFHCKTGSPLGFAFINLTEGEDKALALNGSYLGGLKLEVTMAKGRSEYIGYANHKGCARCRTVLVNRRNEEFYRRVRLPMTPEDLLRFYPDKSKKQ